jgi:hypothetical protein
MKKLKTVKRENVWLSCLAASPVLAFFAVFNTSLALLGLVLLIIGVKGVMYDML